MVHEPKFEQVGLACGNRHPCERESECNAFSLGFIYINNTSDNKTRHSLFLPSTTAVLQYILEGYSFDFTTISLNRVGNLSSSMSTVTVAGFALPVLHATAAPAKYSPRS